MPELMRAIAARLHRFIGDRRRAPRVRARIPFKLSLPGVRKHANGERRPPSLEGFTRDVSATGLALILPAIRIGEHYLTGDGRVLHIVLDFPNGPLQVDAVPVRYERLDEGDPEKGYIVGVRITEISDHDRARLIARIKDEG
ncbi:MAG: PilZ domain-containing protein [Pyrinomonadaceae bacterium]